MHLPSAATASMVMFSKRGNGLRFLAIIQICFFMAAKLIHFFEKWKVCPGFFQSLSRMLWGREEWMVGEIGGERERKRRENGEKKVKKWKWKSEWWTRWMVNEVNLVNMMYAANGKKVKRSKGQKWLFVKRDGLMPVSWIFWYKISSIYNKVVLTRVHY